MQQSINRALLIAGTALFAVLPAAAKDDGSVTFQGQVVNAACSVSMDSQDQIVHMGQVRNSQFIAAGDWAKPVPSSSRWSMRHQRKPARRGAV